MFYHTNDCILLKYYYKYSYCIHYINSPLILRCSIPHCQKPNWYYNSVVDFYRQSSDKRIYCIHTYLIVFLSFANIQFLKYTTLHMLHGFAIHNQVCISCTLSQYFLILSSSLCPIRFGDPLLRRGIHRRPCLALLQRFPASPRTASCVAFPNFA